MLTLAQSKLVELQYPVHFIPFTLSFLTLLKFHCTISLIALSICQPFCLFYLAVAFSLHATIVIAEEPIRFW